MKLGNKTNSINFKTLLYLIIFSVTILVFLMVSQTLLLKYSYEKYQTKKIKNIAKDIAKYDVNEVVSELENIAYENSVCIEYYLNTNDKILYNTLMVGCGLNKNNSQINNLIKDVINSNKDMQYIKLINKSSDTKAILSGIKVANGTIFVYSPLEDLDGASIVLKGQLLYITLIVIVLACFISYFLSNKITEPITKITKKAKELGEGNYNIEFDSSDVLEID